MTETVRLELTHTMAWQLLQDLEAMNIIKLVKNDVPPGPKLSDKYRGILSKDDGKSLNEHITKMRGEWDNS